MRRSLLLILPFLFLVCAIIVPPASAQVKAGGSVVRIDSPYMNKAWRDSVNSYKFRLEAFHQEYYSYDWGMLFSFFPVAGEWYVDRTMVGIGFSAARLGAATVATIGAIRLFKGSSGTTTNVAMLAGGVAGYLILKWLEIVDVQHYVSIRDEGLVEKWQIAEADIPDGSIRYPAKNWPDRITSAPPPRVPQNAREAVDKPLPSLDNMPSFQLRFEIPF